MPSELKEIGFLKFKDFCNCLFLQPHVVMDM